MLEYVVNFSVGPHVSVGAICSGILHNFLEQNPATMAMDE